jgi:hypothetical protein
VIIAEATNMGLGAMAESCGVPYDVLAWTAEWYFRAETLEAANAAIVNYHHRLPLARQLNKGENLHSLRRSLAYAGEGALRRRHHEQQTEQMWCLTLASNAIVTWTTEYHGLAVAALRRAGRHIDDEVLAHIWPSHHENVHFYGTHSVDVDGELAKLDADGYRPLHSTIAEARPGPEAAARHVATYPAARQAPASR